MYNAAYTSHFGLKTVPFALSPDPDFLYLSTQHRDALEHLIQGVKEGNGLILLTGEVGTGKTTLSYRLLNQLEDIFDVGFLSSPCLTPQELLAAIFDKLHLHYDDSFTIKEFTDVLNNYLVTAESVGRKTVLIIDEAQNLTVEVLEQIRLLSNVEDRLLRIVLVGQPELKHMLKQKNLRQLSQRITASFHLKPFSYNELRAYIHHRLTVSGAESEFFSKAAVRYVYRYTQGIARLTNVICDKALLNAYVANKQQVDVSAVRKAIQKVQVESPAHRSPWGWTSAILGTVVLFGGLIWWATYSQIMSAQPTLESPIKTEVVHTAELEDPADVSKSPTIPIDPDTNIPDGLPIPPPADDKDEPPIDIPTELTLLDILQNEGIPSNTQSAFETLFQLWGINYNELTGNTACERALTQDLACVYQTGKWKDIKNYNRPTVIELETELGEQHHAVVTQIQDDLVTLNFDGKIFDYSKQEINQYWQGQFLLLWRPPSVPTLILRAGVTHDDVRWVRKRLNILENKQVADADLSAKFDKDLRRRVVGFQRKQNLLIDGVIGEQTMLLLDAYSGLGPQLK
ncbi:AAA family ATPase [Candidatus Albibeggiatoa sp. nov. NOAA]|uniref:ExeA family protein n=1 Tax=Candidatus Albibeggiatoa sp. nov. NOAA TaxID=3162724 RepID=UPI0032F1F5FF|nr:AAA family ATPase [Thiotrichaceae bacterium]